LDSSLDHVSWPGELSGSAVECWLSVTLKHTHTYTKMNSLT